MLNNLTWSIIDAAAADLDVPARTYWSWHKPGRGVPHKHRIAIAELLRARGMMVAFADFDELPGQNRREQC